MDPSQFTSAPQTVYVVSSLIAYPQALDTMHRTWNLCAPPTGHRRIRMTGWLDEGCSADAHPPHGRTSGVSLSGCHSAFGGEAISICHRYVKGRVPSASVEHGAEPPLHTVCGVGETKTLGLV